MARCKGKNLLPQGAKSFLLVPIWKAILGMVFKVFRKINSVLSTPLLNIPLFNRIENISLNYPHLPPDHAL